MAKRESSGDKVDNQDKGSVKRRAIDTAVSTIEKQFGKGAILTMTEDSINREIETVHWPQSKRQWIWPRIDRNCNRFISSFRKAGKLCLVYQDAPCIST